MTATPLTSLLKKHILGIYLSAVIYNRSASLLYFEKNGMTGQLIQELINLRHKIKHNYEKRLFIVGISELLQNDILPESLRPLLPGLINEIVDVIIAVNKEEERDAKR